MNDTMSVPLPNPGACLEGDVKKSATSGTSPRRLFFITVINSNHVARRVGAAFLLFALPDIFAVTVLTPVAVPGTGCRRDVPGWACLGPLQFRLDHRPIGNPGRRAAVHRRSRTQYRHVAETRASNIETAEDTIGGHGLLSQQQQLCRIMPKCQRGCR
jgi:hypothetical protein